MRNIVKSVNFWRNNTFVQKTLAFLVLLFFTADLSAHGSNPDFFQSIGKIYVVVAVVMVTFDGMILFLIYLERKLRKLEEEIKDV